MVKSIGNRIEAQKQLIAIAEITETACIASVIDCTNSGTSILPTKHTYMKTDGFVQAWLHQIS